MKSARERWLETRKRHRTTPLDFYAAHGSHRAFLRHLYIVSQFLLKHGLWPVLRTQRLRHTHLEVLKIDHVDSNGVESVRPLTRAELREVRAALAAPALQPAEVAS